MRIVLNGEACQVTKRTIDKILIEQGYDSDGIATALNGTFVHKHERSSTELHEGDRLEIVAPIQGG